MSRRNRKRLSVASANRRRKKSKKFSSYKKQQINQDLEAKFARMSITPSKSTGLIQDDAKTLREELKQRRLKPLVPPSMYYLLQDVIVMIGLAETHKDNFYYQLQLERLDATVHKLASFHPHHMPIDWKYDRATVGKWGRITDYFTAAAYDAHV